MDDELERLRARAYGPDADIAGDPAALRRLEKLEAQHRDAAAEPEPASPAETSEADEEAADGGEAAEEEQAKDEPKRERPKGKTDAAPPRRRIVRWLPAIWAVSLLVAASVAATMTFTATSTLLRPVPGGDARQVATIELGSDFLAPRFLGMEQRSDSRGERSWYGLTILVVRGTWYGDTEDECLVIMRQADVDPNSDSLSGPLYTGCSAGHLPAVLQLRVNDAMPDALLEQFPVGTGLRFVLDESRVGVFVAAD
ncbi:MAG: hypothetical protein M3Y31_03580 [Gemmatimonadota bacterium]|nr:hypothetical protein [Gemmatimonadota bacterium]